MIKKNQHNKGMLVPLIALLLCSSMIAWVAVLPSQDPGKTGTPTGMASTISKSALGDPMEKNFTVSSVLSLTNGTFSVRVNDSLVDRLGRHVEVKVNTSGLLASNGGLGFWTATTQVRLEFFHEETNASYFNVTVTSSGEIATYTWITNRSIDPGVYLIRAFPSNGTFLQVENITYYNNPIRGNLVYVKVFNVNPSIYVHLSNATIYRNESVTLNISLSDPETDFNSLEWRITTHKLTIDGQDVVVPEMIWETGDELNHTITFNNEDDDIGLYYFYGEINDTDGGIFQGNLTETLLVQNRPPYLEGFTLGLNSSVNLYRETVNFTIEANVTDPEDGPNNLSSVLVFFVNDRGYFPGSGYPLAKNTSTGNYSSTVKVDKAVPVGNYYLVLRLIDQDNGSVDVYPLGNETIHTLNTPPEIQDVQLGNATVNGTSFESSEIINCQVIASDVEGGIASITIQLSSNGKTHSYFLDKNDPRVEIPAALLEPGTWYLVVNVTDVDGGSDVMVRTIEIIPNQGEIALMTTSIIVSLVLGLIIGVFVMWRYHVRRVNSLKGDLIIKKKSEPRDTPGPAKDKKRAKRGRYVEDIDDGKAGKDKKTPGGEKKAGKGGGEAGGKGGAPGKKGGTPSSKGGGGKPSSKKARKAQKSRV